jgi:hypothetical protein
MSRMTRALRHRNYRLFVGGQSVSLVGTWITRVATSWLVLCPDAVGGPPGAADRGRRVHDADGGDQHRAADARGRSAAVYVDRGILPVE